MRVDIGDTELVGDLHGPPDGPAVVLLHSIGLSTRQGWRAQVGPLADAGYRVVAFDFRGLGESPRAGRAPGVDQFAADTAALMDALGLEDAAVMGVSLGGFVAQALVLAHPEKVRALVLVSTACRIAAGNTGRRAERTRLVRARGMTVAAGPQIVGHFPAKFLKENSDVVAWYRDHYLANDPEIYAAVMEDLGEFCSCERLGRIGCPTLVIAGGADYSNVAGPKPGASARILADGIPGARLETIGRAHHYPHIDHTDDFNRLMLEFLAGLDGGAGPA